jgi:monoamine oxidase
MQDILIIGAGMAGLSAALELKQRGVSYLILEAAATPGGRALTYTFPSGVVADLGGHWLHGEETPLKKQLKHYHLSWHEDKAKNMFIYQDGKVQHKSSSAWLEKAVDQRKAKDIKNGAAADCPVTELARNAEAENTLRNFSTMWNGVDPPLIPSAREFLTDKNVPGGLQIDGGMKALIDRMADEVGRDNIRTRTAVTAIYALEDHVRVETSERKEYHAKRVLYTGSPGVLNSDLVTFHPPLGAALRGHLAGLVMGKMNKIILEFSGDFLKKRGIPEDMSLELLDYAPPHFCHMHSGGKPVATLFASGAQAAFVEGMSENEALVYMRDVLKPVKEMEGFEQHIVSLPVITRWVGNPYTRGAYSACMPGARRSGPWMEGRLCFCGDTFNEDYPASLTGAFLSGKKAAEFLVR